MIWLYRYEAKSIQSYILATQKLREMVGASDLVEQLAADAGARATEVGGDLRLAAAGGATIVFPTDGALERFASTWPLDVATKMPGLQLVQAWVEVPESSGLSHTKAYKNLAAKLLAEKNRPGVDLPEAGPLVARAGRTGRPAVERGDDGLLDVATVAKLKAFEAGKGRKLLDKLGVAREVEVVTDAVEFGEGDLAVVHADGNGVGKRILEIAGGDPARPKAFSEALTAATRLAAVEAVRELRKATEKSHGRLLPMRPIVLGGDDFTVVLRGEDAIPFTDRYLRAFERLTRERADQLGGSLTACAGIAFVKSGFPFSLAYKLAEALCGYAKSGLRDGPAGPSASGLAYFRMVSAAFESLDTILRDDLSVARPAPEETAPGGLLGGPWNLDTVDQLRNFAALARKQTPRGSLREWVRLIQIDRARADIHWDRMLETMHRRDPRAEQEFDRALKTLGATGHGLRHDGKKTPVFDALEWNGVTGGEPVLWRNP